MQTSKQRVEGEFGTGTAKQKQVAAKKKKKTGIAPKSGKATPNTNRKSLGVIQLSSVDKENLVGSGRDGDEWSKTPLKSVDADVKLKSTACTTCEKQANAKLDVVHVAVQTIPPELSNEEVRDMICSEKPSNDYWRMVAERRLQLLTKFQKENSLLKARVEHLETENGYLQELVVETEELIKKLNEEVFLSEDGNEDEDGARCAEEL